MPAARRVYHGVLVEKLENDGALTTDELTMRLGWFELPFQPSEVKALVASARAHGVIEPLPQPGSEGKDAEARWITTQRGRQLPVPRGASARDYGSFLTNVINDIRELFKNFWPIVLAALAAGGIGIANDTQLQAASGVFLVVALVVIQGLRAERDLEAAARAWPRLKIERWPRWKWQTLRGRAEFVAASQLSVAALLAAAWAIDSNAWERRIEVAAAVVAAATGIAYRQWLTPLARAWKAPGDSNPHGPSASTH
jgi:hypothetical protein